MVPRTREPGPGLVPFEELGTVLGVDMRIVAEYLEVGFLAPGRDAMARRAFTDAEVGQLSRALRLARELELHAPAALLLVELLEERDALQRRLSCIERQAGLGP